MLHIQRPRRSAGAPYTPVCAVRTTVTVALRPLAWPLRTCGEGGYGARRVRLGATGQWAAGAAANETSEKEKKRTRKRGKKSREPEKMQGIQGPARFAPGRRSRC